MIRRVSICAEELYLLGLLTNGDLIALIDEPVPFIVRHVIGVIQRWVDQSAPDSTAGSRRIDLVGVVLRWPIPVLAINIADVDDEFARQLGTVSKQPLSHVPLMAMRIKCLSQETRRTSGCDDRAAVQAPIRVVIRVGCGYSTGCRGAEIACVGDVRNLRPACTNDILLVLCQDVSSANPRRIVPRVLSRNLELFISSRDPVRTNTGSDRQPLDRMPPVLDIPGIVTSPDIAAQKAIRAIYRLRMENSVTLRNVVWIVESCIFLNDAAMIGIVRRCLVELTRLQVEPTSKLMRPPCLRNVIGGIACNGRFLSRAYRHRREIVQSRKRGALTCE